MFFVAASFIVSIKSCSISKKAQQTSENANKISKETRAQSKTFSAIQAWATWSSLITGYWDTENRLVRWEKEKKLKREILTPSSLQKFEELLSELEKKVEMSVEIKQLYRVRHQKYEILKKIKEEYAPFTEQFASIDFTLPLAPKIPGGFITGVGKGKGGSILGVGKGKGGSIIGIGNGAL